MKPAEKLQRKGQLRGFWYAYCVLAFVLVLFIKPSFRSCERSTISSIKANMFTLQTLVETHLAEHKRLPFSAKELELAAKSHPQVYWKNFFNPISQEQGHLKSFADFREYQSLEDEQLMSVMGLTYLEGDLREVPESWSGMVLYKVKSLNQYAIYGLDKQEQFIKDKGQPFVLSNS